MKLRTADIIITTGTHLLHLLRQVGKANVLKTPTEAINFINNDEQS